MRRLVVLLALFSTSNLASEIKHQLPNPASVFPQGSEPGRQIEVEVLGQYLDRSAEVAFLDGDITGRVLESNHTRAKLAFDVAKQAAYGPHYFRLISPRGASNVLLFRVGDQPHHTETEPNDLLDAAEVVSLPVTINARLDRAGEFDFFRFRAERGQTWVFDLRSGRMGSGLDPSMILLDSRGRKLEHCEDYFIWDPFFTHTFAETGDYIVVIQPTRDRATDTHGYQLDIRSSPHLETLSPLSVRPGMTTEVTVFGAALGDPASKLWFSRDGISGKVETATGPRASIRVAVAADVPPGTYDMAFVNSGGRSNATPIIVDPTPPHEGTGELKVPTVINGVAQYRRPERFPFRAEAGQELVFEVRGQRYGAPTDLTLRIMDEAGKEVAKNDDARFPNVQFNKDPRIFHKFKEAGQYYLEARNLTKVTGENFAYSILVREPQPTADLMLGSDAPCIEPGGEAKLKISANRIDGFKEPIPITLSGLPEGVTAEPAEIPADKKDVEIKFTAGDLRPGQSWRISATAHGTTGPAWSLERIRSGGGEGATDTLVEGARLAVVEKQLFELEAQLSRANLIRGGMVDIPLEIRRADGFDDDLTFTAENLPPGVEILPTRAAAGDASVTIQLRAAADAAVGQYSHVALIGVAPGGRTVQAPKIGVTVD